MVINNKLSSSSNFFGPGHPFLIAHLTFCNSSDFINFSNFFILLKPFFPELSQSLSPGTIIKLPFSNWERIVSRLVILIESFLKFFSKFELTRSPVMINVNVSDCFDNICLILDKKSAEFLISTNIRS